LFRGPGYAQAYLILFVHSKREAARLPFFLPYFYARGCFSMPRRFPHLRGDSRLYPFAARTALRRRQKHRAWALRLCGAAVLCLAAGLILRDTVFRGGQPEAPVTTAESTEQPSPTPIAITPRAATVDVLAAAESADSDVYSSPAPHPSPDAAQAADILPQYQELYAQNPDLAGWLCIDGTNINYPVVQADNSYYLRRGFDRLYSTAGTLFLDERCRLATPNAAGTANALIYGHNTASGSMFSQLLNYADKAFYTAHPTFRFDTLYEEGTWQVAAVLRTELGADALPYYSFFDASTQEEWQQRVDAILELSLYDTGVVPQYGDQLLTLSTCGVATVTTNSRFAVLAVKIN
jgi:SrtB family sortase